MKKTALVTGGSRGIGFGIANALADAGYVLAINGVRPQEDAQQAIDSLKGKGVEVLYVQGNIANREDRAHIVNRTLEYFGHINVLVNNAGIAPRKRVDFFEVEEEDFDYLMNINQKGTFFMSQAVAKWMTDYKILNPSFDACIVTITSVSSEAASTQRSEYCMSKSSLTMLNKVLTIKMAEVDIPVYEVQPGFIDTDMITKVRDKYIKLSEELALEKRMGLPSDIGQIVRALVTKQIPYSTGQMIRPDGGMGIWRF